VCMTFVWLIAVLDRYRRIAGRDLFGASLFGIVLCAIATGVAAKQPVGAPDYHAIVPPDWKLLSEDPQSHERRFVSPSGDAWLSLFARPPEESIEAHLERVRHHDHERITYERRGATWLVVSGYKGDRIFYRRATLACNGQSWHHLAFEYPANQKLAFDQFVTRASYALAAYNRTGCPQ
jgi:hypothetical protein